MRHLLINATTGEITETPVTDEWILANRSPEIELTISSQNATVNQVLTLSAQLYTAPLTDGNRQALSDNLSILIRIGDIEQSINLVNGQWQDNITFVFASVYTIQALSHFSNSLEVTVI